MTKAPNFISSFGITTPYHTVANLIRIFLTKKLSSMAMASPACASVFPAKTTRNSISLPSISSSSSSSLHIHSYNNYCNSNLCFASSSTRPSRSSLNLSRVSATTYIDTEKESTAKIPSKSLPFRIGHGFDLHRLEPGYPLIIGGINIPHERGCEAHSDGDVLFHCVVDAILGALGLPDIGQIFPDSDPKWKGAASSVFMKEAVRLMHEAGYEIGNLDATLILQKPKLSPHKEAIRANLSELLGADPTTVNLKAKTHEKVDSLGENRSIAAHTVVLLMRK